MKVPFLLLAVWMLARPTVRAHEWHRHADPSVASLGDLTPAEAAILADSMNADSSGALFAPAAVSSCGNSALMASSFAAFKPKVRYYWDNTHFYEESDNMPDRALMPNLMVGITSWQQQIPVPAAYFASALNPENNAGSLGYRQPNYWRLPLVPSPAVSPIRIFTVGSTSNNFQRGAIALAANGVAIFNPANNTGRVSYEIGELDSYGGHCGLADDYHYHIIPTHLLRAFGGVLGNDTPVAWALDGYPIYGFLEPDGTQRQPLAADGGHDLGNSWGYHYHAIGVTNIDASHPFGTPQSPYLMTHFHGTVVNFGGQVDGQPEVGPIRQSGTGGYTAQPVNGASIIAFKNPVSLGTNAGHLVENTNGVPSPDQFLMRVAIGGAVYDECWQINRAVTPRSMTVTWRLPGATTTTTYAPGAGTAGGSRLTAYAMAASSMAGLPDTGQVLDTTAAFGEDADYVIAPQSFTDNGDGTITDNVTGLMWQKVDNGESTWESAVANASGVNTGGHADWRLPTPAELFSLFNHNNGNPAALNTVYFPTNPAGAAEYWWTSDTYGAGVTSVWCANAGGGLGGKPKSETLSAGGAFRYHARYVRGARANNGHRYQNNCDGTITDLDTGLMWTQSPGPAVSWDAALGYAENLSLGGHTDWRLPNVKELQTLTDYALATATGTNGIRPAFNRTLFAKTLTGCSTTSGGATITCADTAGLIPGMVLVDPNSIAGTYLPTNGPVVVSVINATTFAVSAGAGITAGSNLILKAVAPPTAYWSSTSLRADTTKAWLVEHGINNTVPAASGPTRNSQGIVSYESKASIYPAFAVRTAARPEIRSISRGRAVTIIPNLYPSGQRVAGVGVITATNGTVWTVPAATQFADGPRAADLYNDTTGVMPPNIGAVDLNAVPIVDVDPDGEVITGYLFADNYFELYVNGTLVGVDPVPYTPFNSCVVRFRARRPVTYAVRLVDWEENLGLGTELNAGNPHHPGDGGFMASFSDGTRTGSGWKAQSFYIAPLDNPALVVEMADGTHNSAAAPATTALGTNSHALHYPVPANWFAKDFDDSGWPAATTYTEAAVGVDNKPAYLNFPGQFGASGAQFIWSSNLILDNEVIVRYTGAVPPPAITDMARSPNTPTHVDAVQVTARIQPASGTTLTQVQLAYSAGGLATNTVFSETMAAAPVTPWTGANANNPWIVTVLGPANTVRQTLGANHGAGNPCGLEFDKGTTSLTDSMVATANGINAAGSAGYVEFWVATSGMIPPNGWTFQVSTNGGIAWTTRLGELTGLNHAHQLYHYDLLPSERVAGLKLRFQFAGYNAVAPTPAPKADIDDIKVVVTSGSLPVGIPMVDDGLHGDGLAGDGVHGAQIPVLPPGTAVTYGITAIDSSGGVSTTATNGAYTVSGITPVPVAASASFSGGNAVLEWNTQPGLGYSVQWSADLVNWHDIPVGPTNRWSDAVDLPPASMRFFRVMR